MDTILAVDLGTTSLKAILVDDAGITRDRESLPHTEAASVNSWYDTLTQIVRTLTKRNPQLRIAAIAVTGQMHGTQIYDAQDRASEPPRLWTDRSAAPALPALLERVGPSLPIRIGSTIAPGFQALNLFTRTAWDNVGHVLLPKDTLIQRLTGRFVTDPSDAAGSGLFEGGATEWAWDVVDALGIPRHVLPEVIPGGAIVGSLTPDAASTLRLPVDTPVIIAGGDTPVAARGAGTIHDTDMQLMLSTSAQVLRPTTTWQPHPTAMWYSWPAARTANAPGARWLRSGTMSNGGSVIDWLAAIQGPQAIEHYEPVALIALPHLAGRRFPAADVAASGAFFGLRPTHTPRDLALALLQGIAFSYREVFAALTANGAPPECIRFGGGGSQIPGVAQLVATVIGQPLERIAGSDLTCDGAAMLAAETLGWAVKQPETGTLFQPDLALRERFDELYEIYLAANDAALPIAHRLHELA